MKKPTVYVNPVYPQPERQTGTIWEQATKKKRAKYLIYKYLTLFLVTKSGNMYFLNCGAKVVKYFETTSISRKKVKIIFI